MPRKPQPGDFIPRDLIKDEATLDALHALAENQTPTYGQWCMKAGWGGLRYSPAGHWYWTNYGTLCSTRIPEEYLSPDRATPGSWVEVYASSARSWHERWLVGYDEAGRPVTTVANGNPTLWPKDTPIRPLRDKVQKALDELQADGHIITKEMTRTVQLLDTLGLLKE